MFESPTRSSSHRAFTWSAVLVLLFDNYSVPIHPSVLKSELPQVWDHVSFSLSILILWLAVSLLIYLTDLWLIVGFNSEFTFIKAFSPGRWFVYLFQCNRISSFWFSFSLHLGEIFWIPESCLFKFPLLLSHIL